MTNRKNWSAQQIVTKLRQIEIQMAQGKGLALACREISEQRDYRWRKEYDGIAAEQALKDLERKNACLPPPCGGPLA